MRRDYQQAGVTQLPDRLLLPERILTPYVRADLNNKNSSEVYWLRKNSIYLL